MGRQKHAGPRGLLFVVADDHGQVDKTKRKFIRSHVMQGKNTQGKSPRHHIICEKDTQQEESNRISVTKPAYRENSNHGIVSDALDTRIPHLDCNLTAIVFCEEVIPSSRNALFTYFLQLARVMCPIDRCYNFDAFKSPWFGWLLHDTAYLHATLYMILLLDDAMKGQNTRKVTRYHQYRAIKALSQTLRNENTALADSTTATIMALMPAMEKLDNVTASRTHFDGLSKILQLRGGVESFKNDPQLQDRLWRIDLYNTLSQGTPPVFCQGIVSFDSTFGSFPHLVTALDCSYIARDDHRLRKVISSLDVRLGSVFQDLQDFSRLVNKLFHSGSTVEFCTFLELQTSIQYRLWYLELQDDQMLAGLLRLSMLAYLTLFFMNFPSLNLRFPYLTSRLRSALEQFQPQSEDEYHLYTWALIIASITVFDSPDETYFSVKLTLLIKAHLGQTWPQVHQRVHSVLWIDSIHTVPGINAIGREMSNAELDEFLYGLEPAISNAVKRLKFK